MCFDTVHVRASMTLELADAIVRLLSPIKLFIFASELFEQTFVITGTVLTSTTNENNNNVKQDAPPTTQTRRRCNVNLRSHIIITVTVWAVMFCLFCKVIFSGCRRRCCCRAKTKGHSRYAHAQHIKNTVSKQQTRAYIYFWLKIKFMWKVTCMEPLSACTNLIEIRTYYTYTCTSKMLPQLQFACACVCLCAAMQDVSTNFPDPGTANLPAFLFQHNFCHHNRLLNWN